MRRWHIHLIPTKEGVRAEGRVSRGVDEDTVLASASYPKAENALHELGVQIDMAEAGHA